MTDFIITIESGVIVEEYHVTAPSEFEAKVKAFDKFYEEFPKRPEAQVTRIVYDFAKAYERGVNKAESITIGSEFRGAMPEAAKLYEVDSPEYHVFITGYLSVLGKHDVYVNPNTGLVTGFSRKDISK